MEVQSLRPMEKVALTGGPGAGKTTAADLLRHERESAACDADCTAVVCGDGLINGVAGEECEAGPDEACDMSCHFVMCDLDPEAQAMTACLTDYANCVVQNGGVVGYGAGERTGYNCEPPTDEWRFYMYRDPRQQLQLLALYGGGDPRPARAMQLRPGHLTRAGQLLCALSCLP